MHDWTYVRRLKNALEQTIAGVAAAKGEGLGVDATTEKVQLPEIRDSFVQGSETRRAGYEAFFRPTLIRNVWEELDAETMKAYAEMTLASAGDGVYTFGRKGKPATTVILNEKDVVLVNAPSSAAEARAAVRALRELTDKAVRFVVLTTPYKTQSEGL